MYQRRCARTARSCALSWVAGTLVRVRPQTWPTLRNIIRSYCTCIKWLCEILANLPRGISYHGLITALVLSPFGARQVQQVQYEYVASMANIADLSLLASTLAWSPRGTPRTKVGEDPRTEPHTPAHAAPGNPSPITLEDMSDSGGVGSASHPEATLTHPSARDSQCFQEKTELVATAAALLRNSAHVGTPRATRAAALLSTRRRSAGSGSRRAAAAQHSRIGHRRSAPAG